MAYKREAEWAGYEYVFKEPFEPTIELTKDGIVESGVYVRRKIVVDIVQDSVNGPKTRQQEAKEAWTQQNEKPGAAPDKAWTSKGPGRPPVSEQSKRQRASARKARWRAKRAVLTGEPHSTNGRLGNTA